MHLFRSKHACCSLPWFSNRRCCSLPWFRNRRSMSSSKHLDSFFSAQSQSSEAISSPGQCDVVDDIISSNKKITQYLKHGDLESAFSIFNKMPARTTVTWNAILAGLAMAPGKLVEAQKLFDQIPKPDSISFNTMLGCYFQNSEIHSAKNFFAEIPDKDIASWNTMISGFAQCGMIDDARATFNAMPRRNTISWNAMISGYVKIGDLEHAADMFRVAPSRSVVAWNTLLMGHMKSGKIEISENLFSQMPVKNLVTWNSMIAGYVENHHSEDALNLFKTMLRHDIVPDPSTLSSVLLGCSHLSALNLGKQVHQLVCKSPLNHETSSLTSLLSMYCKCGDLEDARKLFFMVKHRDLITWNAMISGYAQHGAAEKALELFVEMIKEGTAPNGISFIGVLSACNHAGLVDLGMKYFHTMSRDYGVEAKLDHYACMADLLGRCGRLKEAVDLLNKMPFKPNKAIYSTLLGACRIHKNLHLAEFVSNKLLDLDPMNVTAHVQLSNVYAARNRWDGVTNMRRLMKEKKVIKTPGCSWIEVKNVIHEFRSMDCVHPETEIIHAKLRELEKKMKLAGYVPDLDSALHDVENKKKEELLLWHSEKQALAFGLLKATLGEPIRVFKNIRICKDCHNAAKFISAIEERELIVRDTTRFHHFKHGKCSCRDYW